MSRHAAALWLTVCAVALLGGGAACHDAIVALPPPSLSAVAVQANPLNALSLVATFDVLLLFHLITAVPLVTVALLCRAKRACPKPVAAKLCEFAT